MHAVLIQALYPPLSLLDCLLWWAAIAAHFWLAHMGGVVVRGRPAIKIPARVLDYGPNNKMAQFSVSIDHRCNLFLMSNVDFFCKSGGVQRYALARRKNHQFDCYATGGDWYNIG